MNVLLLIFSHLGDLITLGGLIVQIISKIETFADRKAAIKTLGSALTEAHTTKDTSALEQIFKKPVVAPPAPPPSVV